MLVVIANTRPKITLLAVRRDIKVNPKDDISKFQKTKDIGSSLNISQNNVPKCL